MNKTIFALAFVFLIKEIATQSMLLGMNKIKAVPHAAVSINNQNISGFVLLNNPNFIQPGIRISNEPMENMEGIFNDENHKMEFLPINLGEVFPNLKWINLKNASLKNIHRAELDGLNNLIIVELSYNEIKFIEGKQFSENFNLELIDLSENQINFIDSTAFDEIIKLRILNLQNNKCISRTLSIDFSYEIGKRCWNEKDDVIQQLRFLKDDQKILKVNMQEFKSSLKDIHDDLRNMTNYTASLMTQNSEKSEQIFLIVFAILGIFL